MRDFLTPGRSASYATRGMVATSHPEACRVGIEILKYGGSAADAALAASAVLGVVEPQNAGIGGDSFYIHSGGRGDVCAYNGSGRTPAGLDPQAIGPIGRTDGNAVLLPGAVDAWMRLHADHCRLPLDLVTPRVGWDWAASAAMLAASPTARRQFMPNGRAPQAGEIFTHPALGATLRAIARDGGRAFYEGERAEAMARTLRSSGGSHSAADFADHRGTAVEPIEGDYRGLTILECPPNGQGMTVLMMLGILAGMDVAPSASDPVKFHHLMAEVTRLGYAERDRWCCDPAFAEVPLDRLLSQAHLSQLRANVDLSSPGSAHRMSDVEHRDTVYLTVVDRDGNAISFINSIFTDFGSGIYDALSGVLFSDRGTSFSRIEGHPNVLAPGKRPMHTIIPAMAMRDGRPAISFGVMGGHYQAAGQVQLLSHMMDGLLDPQEALEAPRSFASDNMLDVEPGLGDAVIGALEGMGHRTRGVARPIGGGQAIVIDRARGMLIGGSDPRKDGLALGY
jgi:gamma-glutamyltranspeptidase/glutathione hydrolase